MQTMEQLRRRVEVAEDLESIVKTMKALAAVGIRRYEAAAEALADYDRTVRLALRAVLRPVRASEDATGEGGAAARSAGDAASLVLVACGSDRGMCGQLNDAVADRVGRLAANAPETTTLVVSGSRLASMLEQHQPRPDESMRTPASIEGVADAAGRLLRSMGDLGAGAVPEVRLIFPRRTSAAGYDMRVRRVLPLDRRWLAALRDEPWPTRRIPDWPGDRASALRAFIREYLFVAFCRALVDTLASEHAARLASMQSAERNIEEKLDDLRARSRRRRQAAITSELMDIVAGFQLLDDENDQPKENL